MDFKVAGSPDGISALQMDIKNEGITKEIMQGAVKQAKGARLHILGWLLYTSKKKKKKKKNLKKKKSQQQLPFFIKNKFPPTPVAVPPTEISASPTNPIVFSLMFMPPARRNRQ
ncbi:hypothetical protein FYL97_26930, partial [Salmonella enterica subsp. enterica serovar Typhimurium]